MKKILLLCILLLSAGAAHAFTLSYTQDTVRVPVGGTRQTDVMIKSASDDSFLINPVDSKTWVAVDRTIVSVGAGGYGNFTVMFSPTVYVPLGLHKVSFDVESRMNGAKQRADLYAYVFKSEGVEIENFFVTGELVASGRVFIKFSLRNIGEVKIQGVDVKTTVGSPQKGIYESGDSMDLEPGDVKTLEKSLLLDEKAPHGEYIVVIRATQNGELLDETKERFVVAKKAVLKDLSTTNINLLKKEKILLFKNVGNEYSEPVVITEKISQFDSNFFKGDAPTSIEGDNYIWRLDPVAPGGSAVVKYSLDYSPLFLTLLIFFAAFWFYMTHLRTLRVDKYIMQKKHIREGEEFTVGVDLKNHSGKTIESAEVYDFVPTIFQYKDTHGPRPEKSRSESGTELKWVVSDIKPGEERVLTYRIIPVVELSGMVRLPEASALFISGNSERENISKPAFIGLDAEEKTGLHHRLHSHIKNFLFMFSFNRKR